MNKHKNTHNIQMTKKKKQEKNNKKLKENTCNFIILCLLFVYNLTMKKAKVLFVCLRRRQQYEIANNNVQQ